MTTAKKTPEPRATEAEILALLERRHAGTGNGGAGEYAFLTGVRNDGGFSATRTFDAVSVALWPSRGYAIHVYEVKCSRSDWVRELKDPAKSEAAWAIGDQFSIVAPVGVVDPIELPHGWGLVEAYGAKIIDGVLTGRKLRTVVKPEWHGVSVKKSADRTIARGLLVAMLRRAGAVPAHETPSERVVSAAVNEAVRAESERWRAQISGERASSAEIADAVRRFRSISGVNVVPTYSATEEQIDETARRIREALADESHADRVRMRLEKLRDELQQATAQIENLLESDERPTMGRVV